MSQPLFPALPLAQWRATRNTIQKYAKVVGHIRRVYTPRQKHWWHVSLRATATGLTTTPLATGHMTFELIMDFTTHDLVVKTSQADEIEVPLIGQSQAEFQEELLEALADLEIRPEYDQTRFDDDGSGMYDETAAGNFWQAISQIDAVFKTFKSGFRQESSPVQLWPDHFDLALLWFSGRLVPGARPRK